MSFNERLSGIISNLAQSQLKQSRTNKANAKGASKLNGLRTALENASEVRKSPKPDSYHARSTGEALAGKVRAHHPKGLHTVNHPDSNQVLKNHLHKSNPVNLGLDIHDPAAAQKVELGKSTARGNQDFMALFKADASRSDLAA